MRKALIAVEDTRASKAILTTFHNMVKQPEEVILLHVERLEGKSLMTAMLGDAELSTLKESIKGTEHKDALDRKAQKVLDYYAGELKDAGMPSIKTVIREGNPAEEILKLARKEQVELIILGNRGSSRLNRLITGSTGREVERKAGVPVLVAKKTTMCEEPYSWRDAYAAMSVFGAVFLGLFLLSVILQKGMH